MASLVTRRPGTSPAFCFGLKYCAFDRVALPPKQNRLGGAPVIWWTSVGASDGALAAIYALIAIACPGHFGTPQTCSSKLLQTY